MLVIAAATLATAAASGFLLSTRLRSYLRHQFIQVLREHYASDVELQRVNVSLYPDIQLVGTELMLRHKGRTDVPPLIHIGKITIHAGLLGILKKPYRLRTVRLEGLQINIPPAQHNSQPLQPHAPRTSRPIPDFLVSEVVANSTQLVILTNKPGKEPSPA